jgi:predicted nucleotidyltransferase
VASRVIPFPDRHVAVLRAVQSVWDSGRFIVIGAAAIARHLDYRWHGTVDLDLSVASALDAYSRDLEGLGWRRKPGAPLRWLLPDDFSVDVLPSEPSLVRQGGFTWPDGGAHASLVGFRLAFSDAVPVDLASGSPVRVASLRSLVVLRIASYLDQPGERDNDLADIAHILSNYAGPNAAERWSKEIAPLGLEFVDVSPFVLGKELGPLVDAAERSLVQKFLAAIDDPADPLATVDHMARRAPNAWNNPVRLRLRLAAFRRGFDLGVDSPGASAYVRGT